MMNIEIRNLDEIEDSIFDTIATWHNSLPVRKNYLLNFSKEDVERTITSDSIRERFRNDDLVRFIVYADNQPIGECNYHLNHPLQKLKNSFWVGISIGDEKFKGLGIANRIMGFLEDECLNVKRSIIEIGVYAFNERGLRFYEKLGYEEFDRDVDFAFWDDKKWPFIRMRKLL